MPKNIAAIDIGTNSTRLLIASLSGSRINTLVREMIITRLGKNISSDNIILKESMAKTVNVLSSYLKLCRQHKVEKIRVVGTSVLRRASNSSHFVEYVSEKTGLEVEVISGTEEARLAFEGVVKSLANTEKTFGQIRNGFTGGKKEKEKIIVLDIGGGSIEIVSGRSDCSISSIKSIELGSVTISEKYLKKDRPGTAEIALMNDIIKKILQNDLGKSEPYKNAFLIGVAGTVSSLGSIFLGMEKYERDKLNGLILSEKDIKGIFRMLSGLSSEERRKIKGLQPERADIIIGGTAILLAFLRYFKAAKLMLSEHDILDGIIYSLCNF